MPGRSRSASRSRSCCFLGGLAFFRAVRAAVRGHDLMADRDRRAKGSRKRYRIGELQAAYGTLRESLVACREAVSRAASIATQPRGDLGAARRLASRSPEGEVLGVIGRNGAGKSTLLKMLTRITTPTAGRAEIRGRVGSLLEVGTGLPPGADRARERLPERRDPRHEAPRDHAEASTRSSSSPGSRSSSTRR